MSRPASLDRLRDISRQRTIRRPLLIPVPENGFGEGVGEGFGDGAEARTTKIEWPIPD